MIIHIKPQNIMCFIIGYMMNFQSISMAIINVVAIWEIPVLSDLATPLLYASFFACILIGISLLLTVKWKLDRLAVAIFFLLSVLVTLMISPDAKEYMWTSATDVLGNPAYVFWLFSFSLFLFSGCVDDVALLNRTLEKMAYVAVGLSLLYYIAAVDSGEMPEYMTFSYNMLFSVSLLIILTIQKFSHLRVLASGVGAVLIFIAGCRGALASMIVAVIAYSLLGKKQRTSRQILVRALLVLLGVLIIIFWRDILQAIASVLDSLDIPSRTIRMILDESFMDDSGRGVLQDKITQELTLFGHGLYGDRLALNDTYVHNILLELLFDYGMLFGSVLIIAWAGVIIAGVIKSPPQYRQLICALLSVGCVKLFLSGSFLNQEPGVYLLLGLCFNVIHAQRGTLKESATVDSLVLQNKGSHTL